MQIGGLSLDFPIKPQAGLINLTPKNQPVETPVLSAYEKKPEAPKPKRKQSPVRKMLRGLKLKYITIFCVQAMAPFR